MYDVPIQFQISLNEKDIVHREKINRFKNKSDIYNGDIKDRKREGVCVHVRVRELPHYLGCYTTRQERTTRFATEGIMKCSAECPILDD